jgi:hypothetical protein
VRHHRLDLESEPSSASVSKRLTSDRGEREGGEEPGTTVRVRGVSRPANGHPALAHLFVPIHGDGGHRTQPARCPPSHLASVRIAGPIDVGDAPREGAGTHVAADRVAIARQAVGAARAGCAPGATRAKVAAAIALPGPAVSGLSEAIYAVETAPPVVYGNSRRAAKGLAEVACHGPRRAMANRVGHAAEARAQVTAADIVAQAGFVTTRAAGVALPSYASLGSIAIADAFPVRPADAAAGLQVADEITGAGAAIEVAGALRWLDADSPGAARAGATHRPAAAAMPIVGLSVNALTAARDLPPRAAAAALALPTGA